MYLVHLIVDLIGFSLIENIISFRKERTQLASNLQLSDHGVNTLTT